jgi:hypothetical protein
MEDSEDLLKEDLMPDYGSFPFPTYSARELRAMVPPLTLKQWVGYGIEEYGLAVVTGLVVGATSVGVKFAIAGLAVTMPVAAIGLGALTGGCIKLAQQRVLTGKWDWKDFAQGAIAGALGGGLGGFIIGPAGEVAHHFLGPALGHWQHFMTHLPFGGLHHDLSKISSAKTQAKKAISSVAKKIIQIPNQDQALEKLITQDGAFKGKIKLQQAALRALKQHDWKHLSMRLADAGYLQSQRLHHYTKHSIALWQKAAEIINDHPAIVGKARDHILKNAAFVKHLHPAF